MAVKNILIFVTILVFVEFLGASPARRQYIAITESSASASPVTSDEWDDNDDFDVDGEGWFSQSLVSSSPSPDKGQEYNEYEDDYSHGNVMVEFGEDDEDQDDDDEDGHLEQDAEEDENSKNDSEFLFVTPKDTRLMLEDDDSDQSGHIKVRHTGRSSYPRLSDGADNSLDSSDDDDKDGSEHPYEFTIDEDEKNANDDEDNDDDDNDNGDNDEDGDIHKRDDSVEALPRPEAREDDDDDEDDLVSEGDDDGDMFENPEEEAAEVIYGDHVFLY